MLFGAVGRTDLVSEDRHRGPHPGPVRLGAAPGRGAAGATTAVLPTHGFGSFCSASPTTSTSSTVGEQRTAEPGADPGRGGVRRRRCSPASTPTPRSTPTWGRRTLPVPHRWTSRRWQSVDAAEVRRRIEAGEWVVDLRDRTAFAKGHVPGTFGFDAEGNVVTYLGWLIPWGTPLTLIGDSARAGGRRPARAGAHRHRPPRRRRAPPLSRARRRPGAVVLRRGDLRRPRRGAAKWRRARAGRPSQRASGARATSPAPSTSRCTSCSTGSTRSHGPARLGALRRRLPGLHRRLGARPRGRGRRRDRRRLRPGAECGLEIVTD